MEKPDDEEDDERFYRTQAQVPTMVAFNWKAQHTNFHMIDDNRLVQDSTKLEREYRLWTPWHPEEEIVFVKAFVKYPKDFERIASFLPDKTVKDCIWYYYTQKNRLDLKRRVMRAGGPAAGINADIGLGWDPIPADPDAVGAHLAFGTIPIRIKLFQRIPNSNSLFKARLSIGSMALEDVDRYGLAIRKLITQKSR